MLSTTAFLAIAMQCAASIHPSTAFDVARVGFNPYAIAEIVPKAGPSFGDQHIISHLPASRGDAEHILRRLSAQDRRYSVGLMQITSTNFRHYGVSATELLDPCTNLSVFEHILRDCYRRGGTLKRALSCYYSGNFSTGQQPETAFSGTSYIQRIGYPPGSSRYAVPGTREDKSSVAVPLKTAPASDSSRHHVIWPESSSVASLRNSAKKKSSSHRSPRRQCAGVSPCHPVRRRNNDTFPQAKAVVPRFGLYADDFFCNPGTGRRISAGKYCHAKVSTGLHGLAAITITVAVIWIGYKTLWKGESLSQCGYIIIGGILIGGGSEIGALLMS